MFNLPHNLEQASRGASSNNVAQGKECDSERRLCEEHFDVVDGVIGIGNGIESVQGNQWDPPQVVSFKRVTGVVLVKTVGLIKERKASAKRVRDNNEEELKRSRNNNNERIRWRNNRNREMPSAGLFHPTGELPCRSLVPGPWPAARVSNFTNPDGLPQKSNSLTEIRDASGCNEVMVSHLPEISVALCIYSP
jgi:hypothetical protein